MKNGGVIINNIKNIKQYIKENQISIDDIIKESKCRTCIRKYEYKTAIPCRYCKWNTEQYWGKRESKMINDYYREVKEISDEDIPY